MSKKCVYCGSKEKLTHDHIPPKNLFPRPRPSNLITVPSCRNCNNTISEDDSYFRDMVIMRHDAGDHPEAKKVFNKSVFKSLKRSQSKRYTQRLINSIYDVSLYTEAGIYVGRRGAYNPDYDRLYRVTSRVIKGLYWFNQGVALPDYCLVKCYNDSELDNITHQDTLDRFVNLYGPIMREPANENIGNGVFEYWFRSATDVDHTTAWVLRFYESVVFCCFTRPLEVE